MPTPRPPRASRNRILRGRPGLHESTAGRQPHRNTATEFPAVNLTLSSLALIRARRPDVHYYNELLIQYRTSDVEVRQVVPDNLVVRYEGQLRVDDAFDLHSQPARPFCVLEYIAKSHQRKDYDENFKRYENELKVPYYLHFYLDERYLTLYWRNRSRYVSVKPNADDRLAIDEIETEVGLLGGWVRYWFRGNLLPLPAEVQNQVESLQRQVADRDAEIARLRAEIERMRGA
jgi:Uma2 family endonuclease